MTKLEQKLGQEFYARAPQYVAQELLGRQIVRLFDKGEVRGIIKEVSAWDGQTNSASEGMTNAPGIISVSTKFGKNLMDIATGVEGSYSCITIVAAEFDWLGNGHTLQGPGNVTQALKIDRSFDGTPIFNNNLVYIVGEKIEPQDVKTRNKKNVPSNCQGFFYIS